MTLRTKLQLLFACFQAQKRKSEVERELASPGKRVRAMPESSNASMILNIQAYNSSPSTAHYGHFPVSPQTPTRYGILL